MSNTLENELAGHKKVIGRDLEYRMGGLGNPLKFRGPISGLIVDTETGNCTLKTKWLAMRQECKIFQLVPIGEWRLFMHSRNEEGAIVYGTTLPFRFSDLKKESDGTIHNGFILSMASLVIYSPNNNLSLNEVVIPPHFFEDNKIQSDSI